MKKKAIAAFTLIELLVVITIIVVLLALLTPALNKAIYSSQLAVCGANLRAISTAVTGYAFDFKRHYPHRRLVREFDDYEISPMNLLAGRELTGYDDRKPLLGYIPINKMLNDPLCESVNMEEMADPLGSYNIYSAYALWYGWQYRVNAGNGKVPSDGSFKMGDKFVWEGERYGILAGDYSRDRSVGYEASSHPDKSRRWFNVVWQDADNPWAGGLPGATSGYVTWSWWGQGGARGPIDLNFAMSDGSVQRYNDVLNLDDAGLRGIPTLGDNRTPGRYISVPAN